jgi:hypothetical protein
MEFLNIDMPATSRRATSKYDFAALTVGGPAMVDKDVVNSGKAASRLQSALVAAKKRDPQLKDRTFKVRIVQIDGADAVAVWRTA